MHVNRSNMIYFVISLFILFPIFFSSVFAIISLKIPSYAVISLFTFIIFCVLFFSKKNAYRVLYSISYLNALFILFFVYLCITYTYSLSNIYANDKIVFLIYNTAIPITIIQLVYYYSRTKNFSLDGLRISLYFYSSALLLMTAPILILLGTVGADGRMSLPGVENPIWVSRFFGTILVILLCQKLKQLILPRNIILISICIVCMLTSGSRTPFLAALIVFFFMLVYEYNL